MLILVRRLIAKVNQHVENANLSPVAKNLASALQGGLKKRFDSIEKNHLLCMASFLDPRFKNRGIVDDGALQECKREIELYISDMLVAEAATNVDSTVDAVPPVESESIWDSFDQLNEADILRTTPATTASMELRQYCNEPAIKRHDDPFEWWRTRELLYPRIAKLARKHLSLVATSVPRERVFSKAGEVLSKKRNRLGNDNCNRILFLNGNMNYY